mgnify:FL=1
MTKSELTKKLAEQFKIPLRHAQLVMDAIFDTMTDARLAGDKIIMRGFGAFTLKVQRDRIGHNPQTNRPIQITGKRLIAFKPGRALFALLNPEI